MRILIVNPNTTGSMTEKIGAAGRSSASPGTEVVAVNPAMGPESIEGYYDEAFSVPGLLDEIRRGEALGFDGYVIACFDDTGLDAARTLAAGPVLGICEAAMHAATMLGGRFSVVTTLARSVPALEGARPPLRRCRPLPGAGVGRAGPGPGRFPARTPPEGWRTRSGAPCARTARNVSCSAVRGWRTSRRT